MFFRIGKSQNFFGFDQLSRYFVDIFWRLPTVLPDHQTRNTTIINQQVKLETNHWKLTAKTNKEKNSQCKQISLLDQTLTDTPVRTNLANFIFVHGLVAWNRWLRIY